MSIYATTKRANIANAIASAPTEVKREVFQALRKMNYLPDATLVNRGGSGNKARRRRGLIHTREGICSCSASPCQHEGLYESGIWVSA